MFEIQSKFERNIPNEVIQHRRLVTPFFYLNLKSEVFKRQAKKIGYFWMLPEHPFTYFPWLNSKGKEADLDLGEKLNLANRIESYNDSDNVVHFKIGDGS